jgi:hypothetical protein
MRRLPARSGLRPINIGYPKADGAGSRGYEWAILAIRWNMARDGELSRGPSADVHRPGKTQAVTLFL